MRDSLLFLSIVIFALIAQSVVFHFTMASADEGYYVMDALKWGRVGIPIADYSSRAPILLWLISFFVDTFGTSLFAFRFPIMLASAVSAGLLFLLGSRLFSRNAGIISGFLYAANPVVLWSGQQIKTEVLTVLFVILAALFLTEGFKKGKWYFFLLSGVATGLAFIERHSAVAFMAAAILAIVYYAYHKENKKWFWFCRNGALFVGGVMLGFAPFFIWVASHNFTRAFDYWFGISIDIFKMGGVQRPNLNIVPKPLVSTKGFFSFTVLRAWLLTFVEVIAVQAWLLLAGFVVFTIAVIQMYLPKQKTLARVLSFLVVLIFSGALIMHSGLIVIRGTFRPYVFLFMTVFTCILSYLFLRWGVFKDQFQSYFQAHRIEVSIVVFWITSLIAAYFFWAPGYVRELIPPFTLAAAILLARFPWKAVPRVSAALGIVSIAGLYVTSVAWYQNPITGGWSWTQESVDKTALFLATHTQLNETILTANPLPVLIAKRGVFLDLYSSDIMLAGGFDQRLGTSPTPHELYIALSTNPPRYAVIDSRMRTYIYKPYPVFEEFMGAHYTLIASFGEKKREIQVWKKEASL